MLKTRMTELFGIKYPIMLAGMHYLTEPTIVSAVCNAGGLGNLAISGHSPEALRNDIKKIRTITDKPFAVNQILISPTAKTNAAIAIEEKVPIFNYTLGRPTVIAPIIEAVHKYGGKVIATVALLKHAVHAEKLGADAIIITGHEAAAHSGFATSLVLIPLVTKSVTIPVIAAGGFYDGRGLAAALALGAQGISMGTRFSVTKECILSEYWKQVIVKATEQDTIYMDVGDPAVNARVFKNKRAKAEIKRRLFPVKNAFIGLMETRKLLGISWWDIIRSGLSTQENAGEMSTKAKLRYTADLSGMKRVLLEGDENAGVFPIGQIIGGIADIPSCRELIERIAVEAEEAIKLNRQKIIT